MPSNLEFPSFSIMRFFSTVLGLSNDMAFTRNGKRLSLRYSLVREVAKIVIGMGGMC